MSLSEIYVSGGIDPRSIDRIFVYDSLDGFRWQNYNFPMAKPSLIGERVIEGDAEYLQITDYRNAEEGKKRRYVLDKVIGKFNFVA